MLKNVSAQKLSVGFSILLAVTFFATGGFAKNDSSSPLTKMPGWGVIAFGTQLNGWRPFDLVAEAYHFSPDGSFYEVSDEGFQLAIAVKFNAKEPIKGHKIPIDASCNVTVFVDGIKVENLTNTHKILSLDFTKGEHTLMIENSCCSQPACWMALVIGKCLWGTDKNIDFVKTGGFSWSKE
jgi:hypothetical protein